jgi:hypothetical protein
VTKGLPKKLRRDDQLRQKRAQVASAWPTAPLMPQKAIPIPSAAKRAPAPLSPAHYPAKRSSLGERQMPRPVGRADK